MQSNTAVFTDDIPRPRRSCSWTYKINKFFFSPNERLNNIMLEKPIEYINTYPAWKFHGKRIQRYLRDREQTERKTKVHAACSHAYMFTTCLITCLSYQFTGRDMPLQKLKRAGHFCVLTGMWVFQNITLHRATNSAKPQATGHRLAFHFVESNDFSPFTECIF